MCDFHSIVVRKDGTKAHIAKNSHSGAVATAKWRENQPNRDEFFVEAEWSGEGTYPGADSISRNALNEKQRKVIDAHYGALAKLLDDPAEHAERVLFGRGIFAGEEYADVRFQVLMHSKCPKRIARRLCKTSLLVMRTPTARLPDTITRLDFGEDVRIGSYGHALPAGLTSVGGYLDLRDYGHALPKALRKHPSIVR